MASMRQATSPAAHEKSAAWTGRDITRTPTSAATTSTPIRMLDGHILLRPCRGVFLGCLWCGCMGVPPVALNGPVRERGPAVNVDGSGTLMDREMSLRHGEGLAADQELGPDEKIDGGKTISEIGRASCRGRG